MREMTENEKKEYDSLVANMEQMKLRLDELTARRPAVYGYARVSTPGQAKNGTSLEEQKTRLKAAGAEEIYVDIFTGRKIDRPKFQELTERLQDGDTLIVTRLDRLGRTVSQASALITELLDDGITVNVLDLGILSNSSVSTLMRNILLSFAQFERDMIIERTQEGKAIARQREGYRDGRPRKYGQAQMDHAMELLQEVDMTGISRATLAREKQRRTKHALKGETNGKERS